MSYGTMRALTRAVEVTNSGSLRGAEFERGEGRQGRKPQRACSPACGSRIVMDRALRLRGRRSLTEVGGADGLAHDFLSGVVCVAMLALGLNFCSFRWAAVLETVCVLIAVASAMVFFGLRCAFAIKSCRTGRGVWRGSAGAAGVRGSNPLSSTRKSPRTEVVSWVPYPATC